MTKKLDIMSAEAVQAYRQNLEGDWFGRVERAVDGFLSAVIDDAVAGLYAETVTAAADPFAFTNVMSRWYDAVRLLAEDQGRSDDEHLKWLMEESDLPRQAFDAVREILDQARNEGWTEYRTKRHLSRELIPKQSSGRWTTRARYRDAVSGIARTIATGTASERVERELRSEGLAGKAWVAQMDERTRHSHRDAHGQVVPVGGTFKVGGFEMLWPGDPSAPVGELANCRCVLVGAREEDIDMTLTASAQISSAWTGVIGMEKSLTGDGRLIAEGALTWETPIPLRYVQQDTGAHDGAQVVGIILNIWRGAGGQILANGTFDMDSEIGREAARQVAEGLTNGISMDLDDVSFEVHVAQEIIDRFEIQMDGDDPDEGTARRVEDGRVVMEEIHSDDQVHVMTSARVRAATIVAVPAFAEAKIDADTSSEASSGDAKNSVAPTASSDSPESIVAAGGPARPPKEWFADPGLTDPTPITVQKDGRVFGHLATWDSCHIANADFCTSPPRSVTDYAYFHTGAIELEDGSEIGVGHLTLDTGHAKQDLRASAAMSHYDNTGTVAADVRAGEDAHGIWVAGSMRAGLSEKKVRAMRSAPLSGDWRRIQGNLELVAALAVNVPGFPIPRPQGLAASGHMQALVASGMVPPRKVRKPGTEGALSSEDIRYLKSLARRERRQQAQALAARARAGKVHDYAKKVLAEKAADDKTNDQKEN